MWAAPPEAVGPGWRPWVLERIRLSFLPPQGRFVDLTDQLTRPDDDDARGPAVHGRPRSPEPYADPAALDSARIVPFWASLIDPDSATHVAVTTPTTAPPPTCHAVDGPNHPTTGGEGGGVVGDSHPGDDPLRAGIRADVVFVDLCDSPVDDRLGVLAARALRGGGVLAVLTRCSHTQLGGTDGAAHGGVDELVDPTGLVVASAQNADLLYLQHIVIPTAPLVPARRHPEHAAYSAAVVEAGSNGPGPWRGHPVAHVDLTVFAAPRPGTQPHPCPEPAPSGAGGLCAAGAR